MTSTASAATAVSAPAPRNVRCLLACAIAFPLQILGLEAGPARPENQDARDGSHAPEPGATPNLDTGA